jgi:hypothetical protein
MALATLVMGRGVVASPRAAAIGDRGADKTIFMWSLVWWPHALRHGIDPFTSHAVWQPQGIDLAWVTSMPGLSVLAFPMTWIAGPVTSYNVLAVLAPALAAWTTFLLAWRLTDALWPALLAGYIFGFSAYEIAQSAGHLNLTVVFIVPLCGLLVAERYANRLARRWFISLLALALGLQLWFSTELLTTLALVGTIVGVLAWLGGQEGEERARVAAICGESAVALLCAGIVGLPYLIHAFVVTGPSFAPVRSPYRQAIDVLNVVVPTHSVWLRPPGSHSVASHFTANPVEAGGYLGAPLLLLLALAACRRTRPRLQTLLLLALVAVAICAFGSRVRVGGHTILPGPWEIPAKLPVTRAILPARLSLYVALFVALVCSLWLAEGGRYMRARWALALVAAIAIFPNPSRAFWTTRVPNPHFFAGGGALERSDVALVLPFGKSGWSMLWQAEGDMRYRMIGGYVGNRPPEEARWADVYHGLITGRPPLGRQRFARFLTAHGATVVVVAPGTKPALRHLARTLPATRIRDADVTLYRLRRSTPS